MKPVQPLSGQWGWQEFYIFSEKLIQDGTLDQQCELIHFTLKQLIQAEAKLWLSEVFYPLPGETIPECVDYGKPTRYVKRAITNKKISLSKSQGNNSLAVVPMFAQGHLIGAIELKFNSKILPVQSTLDFLEGFSVHCALALSISRQSAVKDWRLGQLSLLRQVNLQIARQREDAAVFQNVVDLIQQAFHYYFVVLYTFDTEDQKLHYRASVGRDLSRLQLQEIGLDAIIPLGKGLVGRAAKYKKEIVSPNVMKDSRYRAVAGLPDTYSEACLPLVIEDRLLGILDVQNDRPRGFHENDLVVLRILADNVAAAVEGVQMVESLSRRARQLAAITEVSRLLISILDLDELLHEVVAIVRDKFNYPFVHCFVLDQDQKRLVFEAGTGEVSKTLTEHKYTLGLNDEKGIVSFVAREGRTYIANDVSLEPLYLENALPPTHTRSEMAVPLKYGEEVLGVLDIQSDQVNDFDEEDRFILEVLAANISTALRNANLYRTESWRRQVAESYKEIAGLFSTQFTLEVIYQAILKELMRNLPCDAAAIWLIQPGGQNRTEPSLNLASVEGVDAEKVREELKRDGSLLEWLMKALQSEQPRIRKEGEPVEPLGKTLHLPGGYSAVAAPLWTTDQLLGLIVLTQKEPNRYGADAVSMLATFAGYISIAIQNNLLYTSSVEQAWISTVMLQVAEAAQSAENAENLLNSVARITPLLIGVDQCAFFLLDKFSSKFKLMAQEGFKEVYKTWLENLAGSSEGKKAFEKIKVNHSPVRLRARTDFVERLSDPKNARKKNYFLLPLFSRKELFGAFLVEHDPVGNYYDSYNKNDDQRLVVLQGIARQTAVALENIQLKESGQSEGYITAVLLQVAQTVVSSTNLHETFQTIATILPYLVGVETVLIYQLDKEKQVFNLRGSYSEKLDKEISALNHQIKSGEFPLLDMLSNDKEPIFITYKGLSPQSWNLPLDTQSVFKNINLLGENPEVLFAIPLLVRNELFGALLVAESSTNFAFREKRFEIIRDVAQQLAMAAQSDRLTHEMVDNERMKREMQLANEIQRTFLPDKLPVIPGWEVDVHWHPARQVSGDFYDAFQLPDGRFGFVIADVSDKGIPAALYMTVTRTLVHASAMDAESPARTLYQVNKLLLENSQEGLFTTLFYALIDPRTGDMTYCNAGHNRPGWLKAKENKVTWLEKGGTALGGFVDINLCDSTITLKDGDCVVLYTDGVTEGRSPNDQQYGVTRLKKFLQRQIGKSVKEMLDDLDSELANFRQSQPQSDDITVMAIRRLRIF